MSRTVNFILPLLKIL